MFKDKEQTFALATFLGRAEYPRGDRLQSGQQHRLHRRQRLQGNAQRL